MKAFAILVIVGFLATAESAPAPRFAFLIRQSKCAVQYTFSPLQPSECAATFMAISYQCLLLGT